MKGFKIRLSRTFLLIIGGVTVLGGGSGAAAVYIGADKLLGPSYADINGLDCTTVETIKIKKADRYWIRKYVTTNEPGDGVARLKTALRVARKVQEAEHSDLVQVTVLDKAGPTDRASMRGRAIGAQVVYMPDVSKAPDGLAVQPLTAYYVDGMPDDTGEFWGLRIDLPQEDAEHLSAALTDTADCLDPVLEGADGHGSSGGHGADKGHGAEKRHDVPSGHGETAGDGEQKTDGDAHGGGAHGSEPAADGHGAPAEGHGEEVPVAEHGGEEKPGMLASLIGMVGLGGAEPAADAHGDAASAGHEPTADEPLEPGHGAEAKHTSKPAQHASAEPHAAQEKAVHAAEVAPAEEGWLDTVKGFVGLGTSEHQAEGSKAPEHAADPAEQSDAAEPPHAAAAAAHAPPEETNADDHGAAWLAKMRAQPLKPESQSEVGVGAKPEASHSDKEAALGDTAAHAVSAHAQPAHAPAVAEEDDPEQHRRKPDAHAETH
ncbi:hypothetical protein ABID21_004449 [Pseudorhizobium tarimense]|uniref:Uncharacterized protein n=1 Tax=Pseudorhizobium tarimense TaxID=1079109 RepID=A0ABV2HCN4_9HYPH|nr:hypothetical protein [Pseudorhizobium tarimense]MCJ8521364.1 hypothetical protein [Pseudorhizobium tarimense]